MTTRVPVAARTMRKAPVQQRSRAMVEAIVDAATRVLGARGWAKFTTNEVAEVAGVSIGSLYQYFPSKQALAEAVRGRHLEAVLAALAIDDGGPRTMTLERRIARLIDGVIAAHAVDPALHKVLLDQVPLVGRSAYEEFEAQYRQRYLALIALRPGEHDDERDRIAGLVLSAAVEGAVHAAARADLLASPVFRQQLHALVMGHMRSRR